MKEYTAEYLSLLREKLTQSFNKDELITLCTDLDVNYDDLPGDTLSAKARELIAYLERRDHLEELLALCAKLRPNVKWRGRSTKKKGHRCPTCGTASRDSSFCPTCGARLSSKVGKLKLLAFEANEVKRGCPRNYRFISKPKDAPANSRPTIACPVCDFQNPIDAFCNQCENKWPREIGVAKDQ
ncbi:MAG: hypothetical protein IPH82_29060 [Chloroflexi bacterium]|nr:hypothetical protein [Chloroflexota bacterium]